MNTISNKTLSQLVTENFQAARVFEKYSLDFCCKGKRPLYVACEERQLDVENIAFELQEAITCPDTTTDFSSMSLTDIINYIEEVHHSYIRQNLPQIHAYVQRVAFKHGDRFPFMRDVYMLVTELQQELMEHLLKEEKILFPRIKSLEGEEESSYDADFLGAPIDIMEEEHDLAGNILAQIRELTDGYTPPFNACTTFRISLAALQDFELDLHQHIHIENNILFPRAVQLFNGVNA